MVAFRFVGVLSGNRLGSLRVDGAAELTLDDATTEH
jgi:hypothetical protein